mmetsp:Transcript_112053/g.349220  ORF Transcript_112053/g.349220 Transcript_112053/m.349220 type:complete len:267 (-) Transcript_112053:557-1357(-)
MASSANSSCTCGFGRREGAPEQRRTAAQAHRQRRSRPAALAGGRRAHVALVAGPGICRRGSGVCSQDGVPAGVLRPSSCAAGTCATVARRTRRCKLAALWTAAAGIPTAQACEARMDGGRDLAPSRAPGNRASGHWTACRGARCCARGLVLRSSRVGAVVCGCVRIMRGVAGSCSHASLRYDGGCGRPLRAVCEWPESVGGRIAAGLRGGCLRGVRSICSGSSFSSWISHSCRQLREVEHLSIWDCCSLQCCRRRRRPVRLRAVAA